MSEWHPAIQADAVAEGTPCPLLIGDTPIALYRLGREVYAISDRCTHEPEVRLSDGFVDGDVIECPMHQSCFSIRTGKVIGPPAREDVRAYPIRIEDGTVYVEL
ncbi:non-heme iron oxygenase ferredoxin subunit [Paraburkholderia sp. Ac-20342]|uniref:non-heme iron oxygenase ferredoxin subunit n=1 Tax=Paraburkholderia sp. Ac-20342 TaxID=2703889 RepID=UPI0019806F32|nr:non-heme iron oxygenase ferredoxin subunit [Paraburkholderia sp. Ac-20342]MBN3846046.1 non-heme iron oxygenase ferredoxin subunit [Paraburkholderia sp. Ac-20342]